MKAWTAEERLRLLAVLLARKRQEAMGRAPSSPINHETLLLIAVAPAAVLNGNPETKSLEDAMRLLDLDVATAPTDEELFLGVVADIREKFRPEHRPWWANTVEAR